MGAPPRVARPAAAATAVKPPHGRLASQPSARASFPSAATGRDWRSQRGGRRDTPPSPIGRAFFPPTLPEARPHIPEGGAKGTDVRAKNFRGRKVAARLEWNPWQREAPNC